MAKKSPDKDFPNNRLASLVYDRIERMASITELPQRVDGCSGINTSLNQISVTKFKGSYKQLDNRILSMASLCQE